DFADAHGIDLRLNTKATAIDTAAQTVTTNHGDVISYDKLVLATGSYAFVPPIPGNDRENCFVYRTIEDLDAIRAASLNA
ncbi:FAD-dependent oxidoreductase, partial [Acinetobacter baumannii]